MKINDYVDTDPNRMNAPSVRRPAEPRDRRRRLLPRRAGQGPGGDGRGAAVADGDRPGRRGGRRRLLGDGHGHDRRRARDAAGRRDRRRRHAGRRRHVLGLRSRSRSAPTSSRSRRSTPTTSRPRSRARSSRAASARGSAGSSIPRATTTVRAPTSTRRTAAFVDGAFDLAAMDVYDAGDQVRFVTTIRGDLTEPVRRQPDLAAAGQHLPRRRGRRRGAGAAGDEHERGVAVGAP